MNMMLSHATVDELWEMVDICVQSAVECEKSAEFLNRLMTELEERGELRQASSKEKRECYESILEQAIKFNSQPQTEFKLVGRKSKRSRIVSKVFVSAASIVMVFMLANVITAIAGFEFFGAFSRWTKEALHIISEKDYGFNAELERLKEKLNVMDISVKLPTYIPEGYRFDYFEENESFEQFHLTAWFIYGNQNFSIKILEINSDSVNRWSESNGEKISEIYSKGGATYIVTRNNDRYKTVWIDGNYEITLQGSLTSEQLLKIINSI